MSNWTGSEIALAKRLREEGLTYKAIADCLPGRTTYSVAYILSPGARNYKTRRKQPLRKIEAPAKVTLPHPCDVLRDKQLQLIQGYANDNRIAFRQALNCLLYAGEARG